MAKSSKKANDAGIETTRARKEKKPSKPRGVGSDGAPGVQGNNNDAATVARRRKGHITWWCQRQLHNTCENNHKSHGGTCFCDCHDPVQSGIRLSGTA